MAEDKSLLSDKEPFSSDESVLLKSRHRSVQFISALTVALVALLGLASFILSFESLSAFAAESGAIHQNQSWLFPATVDGAIVIFSVSALRCSIVGDDTRWSMTLVVLSTAASVVFNIAHAPRGFMPALIGATPPLLLFLSFESLLRQISSSLGGKHSSLMELLPSSSKKVVEKKASQRESFKREKVSEDPRREKARQLLAEGTPKRQIARELGLGLATIRRLASTPA